MNIQIDIRNYDEKCKELNINIEKMLEGVH